MDKIPRRRRIYDQFTDNDEPFAANYPLSKQILDYYYKFGQERNLERYLKLNRSLGSKSSSDGSLDQHSGRRRSVSFAPVPSRERCKSMDHLGRPQSDDKLAQTQSTSYQSCVDQMGSGDDVEESSSSELIVASKPDDPMKEQRRVRVRREGGKKSYQINVESRVEIAFPTQFYQAMTSGMGIPEPQQPLNARPVIHVPVSPPVAGNPSPVEGHNDVEQTLVEASMNQTTEVDEDKQRLEWDSLGDVGYTRSQSEPRVNFIASKSCLKGQNKSASEPPTLTSSKSTGAIPKSKKKLDHIPAPQIPPPTTTTTEPSPVLANKSEKWRQLLKKVKDKSSSSVVIVEGSQHLDTPSSKIHFDANSSKFAQSTPVVSPVCPEVSEKTREEKSSQTSDLGMVSRSIQAIYDHVDKTTSMSSNHESTAGSFEFIKGSQVDRGCSAKSLSSTSSPSIVDDPSQQRMNTLRVRKEIASFLGNVTGQDPSNEGDLQKAVDYIALLFDSKSIDRKFKRKLVEKIISKLLRSKSKTPTTTSGKDVEQKESMVDANSTSDAADSSCSLKSHPSHASSKDSTKLSDIQNSDLLKDWLKPMTNSEIEYERRRGERSHSEDEVSQKVQTPPAPPVKQNLSRDCSESSASLNGQDKEKNLQLKCIEREIEYLERIKKLIEVGRMNLMDDTNKNVLALQQQQQRGRPTRISESRTTAEESLSLASTRTSMSVASKQTHLSDWDSHKNLQIVIKDRRKMNTPPDNHPPPMRAHQQVQHGDGGGRFEELKEFVDRRTKEFAERYEKRTSLYTDPSKHYSEPRSSNSKERPRLVNVSTSVNSCEFSCTGPEFIKTASTIESCASRLAAKSKTKSRSINNETATSMMSFSAPVVSSSRCANNNHQRKRTLQTAVIKSCPDSIAYTIVLNPKAMTARPESTSGRTETTTTSTTNASTTDMLYDKVSGQDTNTARMKICETGRFRLEDFLKLNRPDFIEHAEERKEGVETARRRRAQKNHEKENILMSPHLARSRISKLLEESLRSDIDTGTTKVSSNASVIYKQQARRKYKRLPEVVRKSEEEKQNAYKRNTKILAEVFNRNLQRIVLQGETNIPHSRRVLSTL